EGEQSMHDRTDLRVVFPTSFSDWCFRMASKIAQLADRNRLSLTLVHVVPPGGDMRRKRRELDSFMAEADHYDECRRGLVESDGAVAAIARIASMEDADLVAAPSSDRLGFHRLFTRSFRARIVQQCRVPLWTAAESLQCTTQPPLIRTISCVLDL